MKAKQRFSDKQKLKELTLKKIMKRGLQAKRK